ncbi:MAG: kelch repeat-containing protein [Candidatus Zixiibacteriota bacterium]
MMSERTSLLAMVWRAMGGAGMRTIVCSLLLCIGFSASGVYAADDWTWRYPDPHPSSRYAHAMAYAGGDQVLLFGGMDGLDDTWVYDLSANTWTQQSPSPKPWEREWHAMAYIGGDQVLLFGGGIEYLSMWFDDTWVYDLSDGTWTDKAPSPRPEARGRHDMAYIGGDQVLLYEGGPSMETWVYDLGANTWTCEYPSSGPLWSHDGYAMAYIGGDQVVLFGGFHPEPGCNDDTWVYDLSDKTWTQQDPSSRPPARMYHDMAYIGGDQVLLFGGLNSAKEILADTWIYDLSDENWTQDTNTIQPSARYGHGLSETSMDGTSYLVLFGGSSGGAETWTFGGGDYPLGSPEVTVVYPNGGEFLTDTVTVSWIATDPQPGETALLLVDLEYSPNAGTDWYTIDTNQANDSCYLWDMSEVPDSYNHLLRITARDTLGNSGSDICDAVFIKYNPDAPEVTVSHPNGGETLADSVTIIWTAADPDLGETSLLAVDLDYSPDAGTNWYSIDTDQANDSSYLWDITGLVDGDNYLVRIVVTDTTGLSGSDVSDGLFTIYNSPRVTVIYPNGGETLADSVTIAWTAWDPTPGETSLLAVDLDYSENAGATWSAIDTNQTNDGAYFWEITELYGTTDYLVRITAADTSGHSGFGVSDGVFTIDNRQPRMASVTDVPNDQGKQASVIWDQSYLDDEESALAITEYSVWRRAEAERSHVWDAASPEVKVVANIDEMLSHLNLALPGDRFLVTGTEASSSSVWVFIATVPAMQFEQYAYDAPTECDSTAEQGMCWSVFFVAAHTPDPLVHYDSYPDSGYSVDNIPPLPISDLCLEPASWFTLRWTVPGEDVEEEPISGYDIRYSTVPVGPDTQTWWENAQACVGERYFNFRAGEEDSFGVAEESGCHPEAYFAIKALDDRPNASGISNTIHFLCGDLNGDSMVNLSDVVYQVSHLYRYAPAPVPVAAGDTNCDRVVNVGDIVYLVSYLYRNGPPPCGP